MAKSKPLRHESVSIITKLLMDAGDSGKWISLKVLSQLVDIAAKVAGKKVSKNHIDGPLGVRGRNSNNDLIRKELGWDYSQTLEEGIRKTYDWIEEQIEKKIND